MAGENPFGGTPPGGVFGPTPFNAGGATTDTLTADHGSFTLTGQATLFQVQVVVAFGSFTLTGQTAVLTPTLTVDHGTFTHTGQSALFQTQLAIGQGSFTLSGQATLFTVNWVADHGLFAETGQTALFTVNFAIGHGSFTHTGQDILRTDIIGGDVGQFTLSGQDIDSSPFAIQTRFSVERGFEETLQAFAQQRRREQEEIDVAQLVALENKAIIEALLPFVRR